ncbi:CBO0543 family protein [Paenibacillus methanolicus]|uniref:Uncharacterized protein n=1 Tax=Paenibacillus methanolicus TaxID=582686 RepID=A0A5S5BLY1_9BACL|nr:CBO0543 family protein [Paenibacillus methanolicus]TYP68085.1 hypothetical protein BCM02_12045 [Paenibacillus methanolicus]
MNFEEGLKKVDEANRQIVEANGMVTDVIATTFIYSWKWWFGVALIVVPWATWFIIRERKSTGRLLCAGLFIMIFSAVLDTLGIENGLWTYPVKVIPSPTISFSFRLSVLPVLAMVFIQYKPRIHPFLKAVVYGGGAAYIGLPLLATIDMYKKINWQYSYSFGILTVMYLTAYSLYNLNSYDKVQPEAKERTSRVNVEYFRRKQGAR